MQEERATLTRFDNELKDLEVVIKNKKQAISDADLALNKLDHEVQALVRERTTTKNQVATLEKVHEWILEEKQYVFIRTNFSSSSTHWLFSFRQFGKAGSAFDFKANDMGRLKDKARELEDQQKGMKKKINPKVINMIDRYVHYCVTEGQSTERLLPVSRKRRLL